MHLTYIDQEDGPTITVRQNDDGSREARTIGGPWRPVDEVLDGCLQNVADGNMACRQRPEDGEFMFKMTSRGTASAEDLIGSDTEMALLWARAARGPGQKVELTPVAEKVLVALAAGLINAPEIMQATGFLEGQVEQALALLVEAGMIESD